ncbi:glycosyltransferase [Pontibacter sp. BAB1700]|uniref:glycosyltransferase n=1 Tax=Pontibacter sp. BAB1700 TaxID=1144253 RepID=UPI00026BE46E|nr:glycosyltransferase [Pontibacter sp. BAB1700]EJF08302.1 group 1 glycosyl transferase [Pontibacter sp. BAB1700]
MKKYFKYFNKIFAIGHHALDWYNKFCVSSSKIVPFIYCVAERPIILMTYDCSQHVKFLFAGQLIKRKGLDLLLKSMVSLPNDNYELNIIGDGKERHSLESFALLHNIRSTFHGTKKNKETIAEMESCDVLILPSRHDGWGAVINEALMAGMFVICSENCGAKELIHSGFNGLVFSHNKKGDLELSIQFCVRNIEKIRTERYNRLEWSKSINGKSVAKYMLESLVSDKTIAAPWKSL